MLFNHTDTQPNHVVSFRHRVLKELSTDGLGRNNDSWIVCSDVWNRLLLLAVCQGIFVWILLRYAVHPATNLFFNIMLCCVCVYEPLWIWLVSYIASVFGTTYVYQTLWIKPSRYHMTDVMMIIAVFIMLIGLVRSCHIDGEWFILLYQGFHDRKNALECCYRHAFCIFIIKAVWFFRQSVSFDFYIKLWFDDFQRKAPFMCVD